MIRCHAATARMRAALHPIRLERAREYAAAIAKRFPGMTVDDILGRSRISPIPVARRALMVDLWDSGMSLIDVARTLGMDHSSVRQGVLKAIGPTAYAARSQGQGKAA